MESLQLRGEIGQSCEVARAEVVLFGEIVAQVVHLKLREVSVGEELPIAVSQRDAIRAADGSVVLPVERLRACDRLVVEQWEKARAVECAIGRVIPGETEGFVNRA